MRSRSVILGVLSLSAQSLTNENLSGTRTQTKWAGIALKRSWKCFCCRKQDWKSIKSETASQRLYFLKHFQHLFKTFEIIRYFSIPINTFQEFHSYQFLSILVTSHQFLSILVNSHPFSSILVNSRQFSLILVISCQFLSVFVWTCHFPSILVNSNQYLSIIINPMHFSHILLHSYRFLSILVNSCQFSSLLVDSCE